MADRIIADCATALRTQTTLASSTTDNQLDPVVTAAGEHPERAQALAQELGIGLEEYSYDDVMRAGELAPITSTPHHEVLGFFARWRELASNGGNFPY